MRTIDSILHQRRSFEPSSQTKNLILSSLKKSQTHAFGANNYEIPGLVSSDTKKYNHYSILVTVLYILEALAAVSIILTTDKLIYIVVKLLLVIALVILDIIVAKHSRSQDDDLNSSLFRQKFFILIRDFYRNKLAPEDLQHIQKSIREREERILNIKKFSNKILLLLILFGLLKILVFYLDYIIDGFDFGIINSKDVGFLACFYGSPLAYLTIPFLAWLYYGKWIWTGMAGKELENELKTHESELAKAQEDGFGTINNCIKLQLKRPINLSTLIQNLSKIVNAKTEGQDNLEAFSNLSITEGSGNGWRILKSNSTYSIDFYGILTDSELLQIVSLQSDIDAKKLLLLIGMSNQIIQIQSDAEDGVDYKTKYLKIIDTINI